MVTSIGITGFALGASYFFLVRQKEVGEENKSFRFAVRFASRNPLHVVQRLSGQIGKKRPPSIRV